MESKAKLLGHPIHQMLVPVPFGLLATAAILDVIYLWGGSITMATVAYYMIIVGIVGGFVAAPFGTIDWINIPRGTRAKSIGLLHGLGNVFVLVLFGMSALLRYNEYTASLRHAPGMLPLACSFAGFMLAGVTGWLGGELVDRLGVGVDDGAHLDAPSSLSGSPAHGSRPPLDRLGGGRRGTVKTDP